MNDIKVLNHAADNIRILAAAAVEKAKSGHPGGAMGGADFINVLYSEYLTYDPKNPEWVGRDRFFLDPGHMAPMLYSQLCLAGKFTLDELAQLRQWGSPTTGHPEFEIARGIENTSGPLGQGHVFAIGAAIAAKFLAAHTGNPTFAKETIYAYISDGGIEEEISQGGARVASVLGLDNLVMFYDSNDIQLSTETKNVMNEDTAAKYRALGWEVIEINGNDAAQIRKAIEQAKAVEEKQLERYRSWLCRERVGFRRILLFLTRNGSEPETDSKKPGDDVRLQCASWRNDVVPWLHACARLAFDRPFVRESLIQYANLINLITGESTMNDEQKLEIVETATANASSLRGAAELFKQMGAIYNHVAVKIAMDLKARFSSNDDWVFVEVCSDPYWQKEKFIRLKHVKSGVFIRIAPEHLELWDFFIGFDNSDTGRFTDEIRKRFSGVPGWSQTEWWPGWKYLPKVMLNWDGDFLADYLDGDKRRVIDLLLEEVRAIQSLLPLKA